MGGASPSAVIVYSVHSRGVPQTRRSKFESFFGPGVSAVLIPSEKGVDVALISDGSAAGGISDDMEMLPPLMPGLQPRVRVSPEQKALK